MWGSRAAPCLQVLRTLTQDAKCRLLNTHSVQGGVSVSTVRQLHWTPGHTHRPTEGSLCCVRSAVCSRHVDWGTNRLLGSSSHRSLSTCSTDRQQDQEGPHNADKVKVLYDGHCPLCVKEINILVRANKKKQTMEFVDISQPDYDPGRHAGVTYSQAMEVMHVIGKDGQVHTRIAAMQAMYGAVGWGWMWSFANIPVLRPVLERAYDWFARNRLWLTGRDCDTGTCNVQTKPKSDSKDTK